jgi:hypothetical protein
MVMNMKDKKKRAKKTAKEVAKEETTGSTNASGPIDTQSDTSSIRSAGTDDDGFDFDDNEGVTGSRAGLFWRYTA